ncbi:ABC transporter substrate-binding protein [Pusillimonas caeni]|nr:ABC transporter substrate-binding protein [Pusillimonas caeni]
MQRRRVLKAGAASILACAVRALPAGAAEKVIKVGAALPLTGPLSPEGTRQRNGFQLWADTANAEGGIKVGGDVYKVEMIYVDYQSNTPRAVQAAERLITQDKVNFLFAPFGSGAVKAVSAVTEKYGIPMLAPNAASEQVYDQGFKYLFGVYSPNSTLTEPIAEIASRLDPPLKKVAILSRNDLFPLAFAEDLKKSAEKRGIEVAYYEKYNIGTVDFSAALTGLRSVRPDWIVITGYTNDLILVRGQMVDQGIKSQLLTMVVGPLDPAFKEGVGRLSNNITTLAYWVPEASYDGVDIFGTSERFTKLYQEAYGAIPEYSSAGSAVCGAVLQLAIEQAGTIHPAKVRDAIAAMDEMTFYGPVKFAPSGQISSLKPPLVQIQDGEFEIIYPPEIKTADLRLGF